MTSLYDQYRDTLRRGHVAALAGRSEEACAAYREAAAQIPGRAAPWVGVGRMELALDRAAAALQAFDLALAADPANEEARTGRARAAAALAVPTPSEPPLGPDTVEDAPAAVGDPPQISRHVPDDGPEIHDLAERWEVAVAASDADGLRAVAIAFARAERPGAAAGAIRDAIAADPRDPRGYRIEAWLDRRRGYRAAGERLGRLLDRYLAIIDDPDDLERAMAGGEAGGDVAILLDVAERHRRQGRSRSALEAAFAALSIAPLDVEVHLTIARVHLGTGRRALALTDLAQLARALEVHEDGPGRDRLQAFVVRDLRHDTWAPELI